MANGENREGNSRRRGQTIPWERHAATVEESGGGFPGQWARAARTCACCAAAAGSLLAAAPGPVAGVKLDLVVAKPGRLLLVEVKRARRVAGADGWGVAALGPAASEPGLAAPWACWLAPIHSATPRPLEVVFRPGGPCQPPRGAGALVAALDQWSWSDQAALLEVLPRPLHDLRGPPSPKCALGQHWLNDAAVLRRHRGRRRHCSGRSRCWRWGPGRRRRLTNKFAGLTRPALVQAGGARRDLVGGLAQRFGD